MTDANSVIPLAQLRGFRIASGTQDMRLWQVESADGCWIGTVDELLVDPATMEVRYLDVEVENLAATGRERHVLIPVGSGRPHEERSSTLVVDGLTARAIRALPTYPRGTPLSTDDARYSRPFAAPDPPAHPARLGVPLRIARPSPVAVRAAREMDPRAA